MNIQLSNSSILSLKRWKAYILIVFLWIPSITCAQIQLSLDFQDDSLWLGKSCMLKIEVIHPEEMYIQPLDESSNFFPFELEEVLAEPTITENGISTDRAIYHLKSFSIQAWQKVKLPVLYVEGGDTLIHFVESDSIRLVELVDDVGEAEFLRDDALLSLEDPLNLGRLALLIAGFLFLVSILFRLLKGPVKQLLKKRRLRKEWNGFKSSLKKLGKQNIPPNEFIRSLNRLWKSYLDPGEQLALHSKTTTELAAKEEWKLAFTEQQQRIMVKSSAIADDILFAGKKIEEAELKRLMVEVRELMEVEFRKRLAALKQEKKA